MKTKVTVVGAGNVGATAAAIVRQGDTWYLFTTSQQRAGKGRVRPGQQCGGRERPRESAPQRTKRWRASVAVRTILGPS